MNCPVCGSPLENDAKFCTVCGTKLAPGAAAPVQQVPVQQPQSARPISPEAIPERYSPITPWGYVGYNVLFAIPVIGFIFLLIFTFSNKYVNRRNYARSFWCALLIMIILWVVAFAIAYATGSLDELQYSIESYTNSLGI